MHYRIMKKVLFLLLLLFIAAGFCSAQGKGVKISNSFVKKLGDQVSVSFDIESGAVLSNYKIVVSPVLYDGKGNSVKLAPVSLTGKKKNLSDLRSDNIGYDRVVMERTSPKKMRYATAVPFQPWMEYVSLVVEQKKEGCCGSEILNPQVLADNILLYYDIVPHYDTIPVPYALTELEKYDLENPFLHPMEDYGKRYEILEKDREKGSSIVYFKVGSHQIDLGFQGNDKVFAAIQKAFDLIAADPNATLKNIMIAGYASPEGSLAFNTKLAQNRAESVRQFLQMRLRHTNEHQFEVYNGREDWGGLREKVEKSFMAEQREVLYIIDSYSIEQEERKARLQQLHGGVPYRYMLDHFYPLLRSAGYIQVYYEINRAATTATAVTDENGRTTWVDPDSPINKCITALNRAIPLMQEEKYAEALLILQEFKEDARVFNPIGVCYMMLGNYRDANMFFQKAALNQDVYATHNMEEIKKSQRVME